MKYLVFVGERQVTPRAVDYNRAEDIVTQWEANGYEAFIEETEEEK